MAIRIGIDASQHIASCAVSVDKRIVANMVVDKPIENMPVPQELVVPMGQHIGAPCNPTVKVGDMVKAGQQIGAVSKPYDHSIIQGGAVALDLCDSPF